MLGCSVGQTKQCLEPPGKGVFAILPAVLQTGRPTFHLLQWMAELGWSDGPLVDLVKLCVLGLPQGTPGLSNVHACGAMCCGVFVLYRTPNCLVTQYLTCVMIITILSLLGVFFLFCINFPLPALNSALHTPLPRSSAGGPRLVFWPRRNK